MAIATKPNVAVVETDGSDGIKITLLGELPPHIPARHEFNGVGLKQIDTIMLDLGVHVVAWLVTELPMLQYYLPMVLINKQQVPSADKPLVFSP